MHTFVDLPSLEELHLEDNKIARIDRRAFMNMDRLKRLHLRGNKLRAISDEAFQNLPELELLDLAYNKLQSLDFSMLDQVSHKKFINGPPNIAVECLVTRQLNI
jgi:Leucine-rich repeat (LRR) protein